MRYKILVSLVLACVCLTPVCGQVFTCGAWEQKNAVVLKMSQLYYEANVGINMKPGRHVADFIYLSFGYGNPTRRNAWRKFLPDQDIPEGLPKTLQQKLAQSETDDLHAGKVGIGWNHWFNHVVGFYVQAGWGFIADLSTGDDLTTEEKDMLSDGGEKNTFIYNTVPVELGLTLNLWQHLNVQAGVTYMWKEIPLLTVGIGYAF